MRHILTPDDMKKGELMEPGWKPVEYFKYEEGEASDDAKSPGSTNCIFHFKVIDGPEKGIECKRLVNETALGFGKNLFITLGLADKTKGGELSSEAFRAKVGTKLQVYIKRGKSNKGNEFNDCADFRPLAA